MGNFYDHDCKVIVDVPHKLMKLFGGILVRKSAFQIFQGDVAVPMIRISTYINLVVMLIFWMGLIFETPLMMFIAAKAGVVSADTMAKGRRIIIVVAFLLGAVVTPTFAPVNQTLVAIPFLILFEIGLRLARCARSRRIPDESSDGVIP